MMKGRSGMILWDDTIRLGIEWRKKVRAIRKEFEENERDPKRRWFFDPSCPTWRRGRRRGSAVGEPADRRTGLRRAATGS